MNFGGNDQALERESTPKSEMEVLKNALFGTLKDHTKSAINSVVPSGHLDSEQLELLHMYHDMYSDFEFLKEKYSLPENKFSNQLLEKIAAMSHFSKAEEGFASEMLITRKSQQFQAMKQKSEVDNGPSIRKEIAEALNSRTENTGSEIGSPDPSW